MLNLAMGDAGAIWAGKSDNELLDAADELFNYTEAGERVIRAELRRRGLAEPNPPIGTCSRCGRSIPSNHPGDRCSECDEPFPPDVLRKLAAHAPEPTLVSVLRTEDPGLVPLAKSMLDQEGIEHLVRGEDVQDPFGARLGVAGYGKGPVEFWVREEDAERASRLLAGLTEPPAA
jgi:hypothetical protein